MPSRSPLARVLLGLGLCAGGLLALAGMLPLGGSGLVAVAIAGTVSGAMAAGLAREAPGGSRGVREVAVRAGAGTVVLLLLVAGTTVLAGGVVAALATGLLAVGTLAWWLLRAPRGRRAAGAGTGAPTAGADGRTATPRTPQVVRPLTAPGAWGRPVSALQTADLGREWLRTTAALAGRLEPATRQSIVRRREQVLDELERRDPAGFARWLAAGHTAGTDPARYVRGHLRGDRAAGTDAA